MDEDLPERPHRKLTGHNRDGHRLRLSRTTTESATPEDGTQDGTGRDITTYGMSTLVKPINSMFGVTTELKRSVM